MPFRSLPNDSSVSHRHSKPRSNRGRLHPVVEALQALRGVPLTVAGTMVAAIGDPTRFDTPRELMKFLGLIPSAYPSAERRRQGSITKAGNTHARRALVESAWASRYPAKVSRHLQLRLEKLPTVIQDISWKAQVRLCQRSRRLVSRGKHAKVVTVAIARELVGCMWAMAKQVPVTASVQRTNRPCTLNSEGLPTCLRKAAAPVWCNPRQREEAARYARPSIEAGTRRRQGRWYPTHGEQRDQPSCLPGSGSSERERRKYEADVKKLLPTLDIGSHINAGGEPRPKAEARNERKL